MNTSKYYSYGKCTICNNLVKYHAPIIKTSKLKHQIDNKNICANILCNDCFSEEKYVDITKTNKSSDQTKIFLYNQKLYISKNLNFDISNERKQELISRLNKIKISYKNFKDELYYQYVMTGKPDIETIIKHFIEKQNIENDRFCQLLEELKKLDLVYDNMVPSYKKYIKYGGNLKQIIKTGELEKMLIKETNYLSILSSTDSDTARDIAIVNASKKTNKFNKYIIKKTTVTFD